MKHLSKITSIPSTSFGIVNSTTPTQVGNTKEIKKQLNFQAI